MNVLTSLDGAVQRQGIKLEARDWLDIGSETWSKTSDYDKAAAYQAAKMVGWKDEGLKQVILRCWGERFDASQADAVIEILQSLEKQHPLEIEELKKETHKDTWKVQGIDKTFQFPEV